MISAWAIYVLVGALGFVLGLVSVFRGYSEKLKDVLLDLKVRGKLDTEEYEYFTRKYITREDKTKRFVNVISKIKRIKKTKKEDVSE